CPLIFVIHVDLKVRLFFFFFIPPPPISTLFPYTTLFRSVVFRAGALRPWEADLDRQGRVVIDDDDVGGIAAVHPGDAGAVDRLRSEEHTSELHHRTISYAVFCLKKKNTNS